MDELNTNTTEVVENQEVQTTQPSNNATVNTYGNSVNPPKSKGLSVASLVLGIISVVFSFIPFISVIIFPTALVSLILGIISLATKKGGKGMAITGIILSVVGVIIAIVMTVLAAGALLNSPELNDLMNSISQAA